MSQDERTDQEREPAETPTDQAAGQATETSSDQSGESAAETPQASGDEGEPGGNGEPPTRPRRWPGVVAVLALLLAIAGLGGLGGAVYYGYQQLQAQAQRAAAQSKALDDLRQQLEAQGNQAQNVKRTLNQQLSKLERQQQGLRNAIQRLREDQGQDRQGWVLAEAEYLLQLANQRLQLAGDVDTALAALRTADQRLQALGDPALMPVREALHQEMTALEGVARPDIAGTALTLATLADQVDEWPLQGGYRPEIGRSGQRGEREDPVTGWRGFVRAVWNDLKGLVRLQRRGEPVEPMLAPEHGYFLRENLRLKLESARLALLEGNPALYRDSLGQARDWIEGYFDTDQSGPGSALRRLGELAELTVRPERPDISGSLRALRKVRERLDAEQRAGGERRQSRREARTGEKGGAS